MTDSTPDVRTSWPGDAPFARQLEDLDRQVNDWVAVVRSAHASLRRRAATNRGVNVTPTRETEGAPPAGISTPGPADEWDPAAAPPAPLQPEGRFRTSSRDRPAPRAAPESDEALLNSLEAEALRWVRIRQRIAPGKSVRELLAEFEAASPEKGGPRE